MRLDFLLVLGIFTNIILTVLFPTQILGFDPFGTESSLAVDFNTYDVIDQEGAESIRDSNLIKKDNEELSESANLGDETAQFVNPFGDSSGGFLDWIGVALVFVISLILFFIPFMSIIWLLPTPINFILGSMIGSLYFFAVAKWVGGR